MSQKTPKKINTLMSEIEKIKQEFFAGSNIFELTGMGTQEIKHSNYLAYLFGLRVDGEYYLLDKILSGLGTQKLLFQDVKIYREVDNIDILIRDEANKTLVVIENKVFSGERIEGEDNGQLGKYMDIVQKKYSNYQVEYIYLTPDCEKPSDRHEELWKPLSYETIYEAIKADKFQQNMSEKERLVLCDYIELLKRKGIIMNEDLKNACQELWKNPEYKDCLRAICTHSQDLAGFKTRLRQKIDEEFAPKYFEHTNNGSHYNIFTQEWMEYFKDKKPDESDKDSGLYFGLYITPKSTRFWILRNETKSLKADKAFQKLKETFSSDNKKGKNSKEIWICADSCGYDGFNMDEVENEVILYFIEAIKKSTVVLSSL